MRHNRAGGWRPGAAHAASALGLAVLAVLGVGIVPGTDAFAHHTLDPYDHPHLDYDYVPPILNAKTNEITFILNSPVYPSISLDKVQVWMGGHLRDVSLSNAAARSDDGVTFVISLTDEHVQDILSRCSACKLDILEGAVEDTNNLDNKHSMYSFEFVGVAASGQGSSDNTAPVITLAGDKAVFVPIGSNYTDAGAECEDDADGAVRTLVSNPVDVTTKGEYTITYMCTDSAGNKAVEETRTVTVSGGAREPSPTAAVSSGDASTAQKAHAVLGALSAIAVGTDYVTIGWPEDAAARWYSVIVVDVDAALVSHSAVTDKTLYNITGLSPGTAYSILVATNHGTDVPDSPLDVRTTASGPGPTDADVTAPVITMIGQQSVSLDAGDAYSDAGATCADDRDGSIPPAADSNVDPSSPGTYRVTYSCADAAGNQAAAVTRTVVVGLPPDTTAPVITMIGQQSVSLDAGDAYSDAGATCADDRDGSIPPAADSNVDPSSPGTYRVTYSCADAAGNQAAAVTRTVVVGLPPDTTGGETTAYSVDPSLIQTVQGYAAETHYGTEHVDRWNRVLDAFGVINHTSSMTAAQARQMADNFSAKRWNPIVDALAALEEAQPQQSQDKQPQQTDPEPYTVDPVLIQTVQGYAAETHYGTEHVDRWNRVLDAFGVINHTSSMTAAQAQQMADNFSAKRWNPIVDVLTSLEADRP